MEPITFGLISVTGLTVIFALFWREYRKSTCHFGGSNSGRDYWIARIVHKQIKRVKLFGAWVMKPRYTANENSEFQDIFGS